MLSLLLDGVSWEQQDEEWLKLAFLNRVGSAQCFEKTIYPTRKRYLTEAVNTFHCFLFPSFIFTFIFCILSVYLNFNCLFCVSLYLFQIYFYDCLFLVSIFYLIPHTHSQCTLYFLIIHTLLSLFLPFPIPSLISVAIETSNYIFPTRYPSAVVWNFLGTQLKQTSVF